MQKIFLFLYMLTSIFSLVGMENNSSRNSYLEPVHSHNSTTNSCHELWKNQLNKIIILYGKKILTEDTVYTIINNFITQPCFDKTLLENQDDTTFAHSAASQGHKRLISLLAANCPNIIQRKNASNRTPEESALSRIEDIEKILLVRKEETVLQEELPRIISVLGLLHSLHHDTKK